MPDSGFGILVPDFRALTLGFGVWTLDFCLSRQPRRQILLCALLNLQPFRDQDNRALREQMPRQGGDERLR